MFNETDVRDAEGNVVISPGLKVRHKASQYEYTVDNVIQDPNGEIQVILRLPEEPRFLPPPEGKEVMHDAVGSSDVLYEVDPDGFYAVEPEGTDAPEQQYASDEQLLAVPQAEFEADYEVK
jgi:hypothetical protein